MTLKEKFEAVDTNHKNYLEGIEEISDEFTINFAEWFYINKNNFYKGERDNYLEFKQILEIYKKEKEL